MSVKVEGARRAEFKEIARSIIARDRTARKNGWSQNTIGEIERALVTAYISGRSETTMRPAAPAVDFVNWIEIPPRARDALWFMSVAISGSGHDGDGRLSAPGDADPGRCPCALRCSFDGCGPRRFSEKTTRRTVKPHKERAICTFSGLTS